MERVPCFDGKQRESVTKIDRKRMRDMTSQAKPVGKLFQSVKTPHFLWLYAV